MRESWNLCTINGMDRQIKVTNAKQTKAAAEQIGQRCKGGEVIELVGDLGAGKTTFVQGLAKGLGSTDHVASPTFAISRLYKGKTLELHHFDFYRLDDGGLIAHELHEIIHDPQVVVVIEWGDIVAQVLPEKRLTIRLTATSDQGRRLDLHYPPPLKYLVEDV